MSGLRTLTLPRRLLIVGVAVYVAALVLVVVQWSGYEVVNLIVFGAYVLVGGLIVVRRHNALGLLLVAYGSLFSLGKAVGLVTADTLADAGRADAASWAGLVGLVAVSPGSWLLAATWLVFPDGRPRTTIDRRLLVGSGALALLSSVVAVFATPQVLPEIEPYPHPFVEEQLADVLLLMHQTVFVLFFAFGILVAARLFVRTRHGDPLERRQVRWVATAVMANITILVANAAFEPLGTEDSAFLLIDSVASLLIPLAVGVAIMRYRLYEIDRIISRSVTYGALAIFIGGVYVATVVVVGAFLGGDAGFGLSIASTALVAIVFQPVRRWVERWADRLVYGDRATPHEILVQFSHRSSELSDDELVEQAPKLIVDGIGGAAATLWVRRADGFRYVSSWPPETPARSVDDVGEFVDPEADKSWPVRYDDELLGGISVVKGRSERVTETESALLSDLASALGLALRNTRLTAELRRQVAELEASRVRVLAAADAARRELEHSLDSGPQQQLVALKVKLGPTRKRAEQLGATRTAALLAQLEQEAGHAIVAVREFSRGIHPPLLESGGLAEAIELQARRSTLAVSVRADGVGRYAPEVESAVYFTVLEALQNTSKYAGADSAFVHLAAANGELEFEITDDGCGFDVAAVGAGTGLRGMADRLEAVGGSVTVDSDPGRGTRVVGAVPIAIRAGV
ncbi:MAG: ATP-binding protein [Actinomycetota bacterium]